MKILKYLPVLTAAFVFIVYMFTLAPSVIQIDSGELAAVQVIAGIAHPTGYPLFTMTGFLWSLIPLPLTKILQMNILAALWCSIAAGLFVSSFLLILNNRDFKPEVQGKQKKKKGKEKLKQPEAPDTPPVFLYITASAGALFLAFSRTFWFQSTSVEVYSLHLMLIMLIVYFLLKAFFYGGNGIAEKKWLIFAVVLALGFSNHMTTLLVLPGTAYLYFMKYGFNRRSLQRLGLMILVFLPVLIGIYSYLPLRSLQNPVLDWGNPETMQKFLWHVSGKQYQTWLFSSTESAKKQFIYFFSNLPNEFGFTLILAVAGIFFSYRYSKKIFVFLLLLFLSTILYSINYDIVDIDSYFLLAYIALAFFSAFSILFIANILKGLKSAVAVLSLIIFLQFYMNFRDVNQSRNYAFEDYTKAILGSVPENSVIFGYQWDFLISPSYYFQYAENYRRDVAVIDKELLRRSWYYHQLQNNHPDVISGIKNEIQVFTDALKPFENDRAYDANLLESSYRLLMTNLVLTNTDKRNFYITPELFEAEMSKGQFTLPEGYTIVPDLLYFRVVKGNSYVPAPDPSFKIRLPENRNTYLNTIEFFVGSMLARRAIYEMQFDKRERALVYINKLKSDFPGYGIPPALSAAFN